MYIPEKTQQQKLSSLRETDQYTDPPNVQNLVHVGMSASSPHTHPSKYEKASSSKKNPNFP